MELYEYSDEDLKRELKRRAVLKANKTKESRIKDFYWNYWIGKIKSIQKVKGKSIYYYRFYIEEDEDFGKYFLAQGFGFNYSNIPKIGDIVKLRYRKNQKVYSGCKANSKIIEILTPSINL